MPSSLTTAELRILHFLPTHLSFREIAERTYVSANTVKTQANAVYRKLDVRSRSEAVTLRAATRAARRVNHPHRHEEIARSRGQHAAERNPPRRPTRCCFAADYPFLNVFWTMILFFFWVAWIWVLIMIVSDVFRRHDASGFIKALWMIFLIFLPFLGVLVYMIVNSKGMAERNIKQVQANQAQFDALRQVGRGLRRRPPARSRRPRALLDSGAITQAEFDSLKAKALA